MIYHFTAAQEKFHWGDFSKDYLQMQVYDKDTGAAALVLLDYGEYTFDDDYETNFEVHQRIKILKTSAYDEATVIIPYHYYEKQKVMFIRASGFQLQADGSIQESKVQPNMIYDEDLDGEMHQKKFTIPNIRVGTVLEYKYTIHSPNPAYPPDWYFESHYPVVHGEFMARVPRQIDYLFLLRNPLGYIQKRSESYRQYIRWRDEQTDVTGDEWHWEVNNIPAFKKENYITSEIDYLSRLTFHLQGVRLPGVDYQGLSSWDDVNKRLLEVFFTDRQMSGKGIIGKVTDSLVAGITDPLQRTRIIYDYVRSNIIYTDKKKLTSMNELNKVMRERRGDLGDIACILTLMLSNAGLDANLAITSTRDNGYPEPMYPSLKQFDYLLSTVKIDTTRYYLDATNPDRPWTLVPSFVADRPAFLIDKDHWMWSYIPAKGKKRRSVRVIATLDIDGQFSGEMKIMEDGYSALNTRNQYKSTDSKDQLLDLYGLKNNPVVKLEVTDVQNLKDPNSSLTSAYLFTTVNVSNGEDIIYFSPLLTKFMDENPFKPETRNYPVDFGYLQTYNYVAEFTLPENYIVDELPPNLITKLPDNVGEFKRLIQVEGNKISMVMSININQAHFEKEYYPALREFFDKFISVNNDQIVLKKKL